MNIMDTVTVLKTVYENLLRSSIMRIGHLISNMRIYRPHKQLLSFFAKCSEICYFRVQFELSYVIG